MKTTSANQMWRGQVYDRLTGKVVYESRTKTTWGQAQQAAERKARTLGCGDRFAVRVA